MVPSHPTHIPLGYRPSVAQPVQYLRPDRGATGDPMDGGVPWVEGVAGSVAPKPALPRAEWLCPLPLPLPTHLSSPYPLLP